AKISVVSYKVVGDRPKGGSFEGRLQHSYGKESRHRRVSGEGENDWQVPGEELHGEGLFGSREGSAQEESVGGRRQRLQAGLRGDRRQKEADRGVENGCQRGGFRLSGG